MAQAKSRPRLTGTACEAILSELVQVRQLVLLATPYFAVEARCMERSEEGLSLRIPMSKESLKHALGQHTLRLRFPWDLTMFAGPIDVLGFEEDESLRLVRISAPPYLEPDDQRAHIRVEQVGRSRGTLSLESGRLVRVSVENISPGGVGVFCQDHLGEPLIPGRTLKLDLILDRGPHVPCNVRLCHQDGQTLGLAFLPDLDELDADALKAWWSPKVKEARKAWENRMAARAAAEQALKPKAPPEGVLLITSDALMAQQVQRALEGEQPVRVAPPALGPLRAALDPPPLLVLTDISGAGLDARHRLKSMLESLHLACPVVVLARKEHAEVLRTFAAEIKAAWSTEWNPQTTAFFLRLIRGIIHRASKSEDPPQG